jgi:hypothetical protein
MNGSSGGRTSVSYFFDIVFFAKAFYAACCVNELLLACKKRVAGGTDFNLDVFCG